MTTSLALLILSAALCAWLALRAMRDQRRRWRSGACFSPRRGDVLSDAVTVIGPDQYPIVTGQIPDGRRVKIELIADTLVTRRLPQLWLRVTLYDASPMRPTIGVLARPTGSEYYSLVHDMPQWMTPHAATAPMLMRGDGNATPEQAARMRSHFGILFADAAVKEAVISPKGLRVVRQAAQASAGRMFFCGSRGSRSPRCPPAISPRPWHWSPRWQPLMKNPCRRTEQVRVTQAA